MKAVHPITLTSEQLRKLSLAVEPKAPAAAMMRKVMVDTAPKLSDELCRSFTDAIWEWAVSNVHGSFGVEFGIAKELRIFFRTEVEAVAFAITYADDIGMVRA